MRFKIFLETIGFEKNKIMGIMDDKSLSMWQNKLAWKNFFDKNQMKFMVGETSE